MAIGPDAFAQTGDVKVVVFEGKGLGHGVGLPLDGANAMALDDEPADEILRRFFPETNFGEGEGLVRVLLGARDDLDRGLEILLPDGGTVRDGRTTPVAPSFPLTVPANGRVRLSFSDGLYRAEVLDERSVSGTVELTPTSAVTAAEPDAETTTQPEPDAPGSAASADAPGLGASQASIWVQPRRGGRLVLVPGAGGEERTYRGPVELVAEAERLHLVAELDVEEYLSGLGLALPGATPLEPAALEAALVASRSYALRSARAEPRVGRFHLYADERSLPYVGKDAAPLAVGRTARATAGEILEHDGLPAAAMITVSAGGSVAAADEIFGEAGEVPYLPDGEYAGGEASQWRVDVSLNEVARRLGYPGAAESLAVTSTTPSGRPAGLRITGDAGAVDVAAPEFHPVLRLPSSDFAVTLEERADAVAARADSPPFQELPGPALSDAALAQGDAPSGNDSGRKVPLLVVAGAGISLVVALAVLLVADVQRRVRAMRERRSSRRRHPAGIEEIEEIEEIDDIDDDRLARPRPVETEEVLRTVGELDLGPAPETPSEERPGSRASDDAGAPSPPVGRSRIEGPVWHNEPEWLADLVPEDETAPSTPDDFDEGSVRRELERMRHEMTRPAHPADPADPADGGDDEKPPATRPLSEVLGWDDAPDWLDDLDDEGTPDDGEPDSRPAPGN